MRGIFILLIVSCALPEVFGQEVLHLSLDDCIDYALKNSEQIKITALEKEIANAEVRKTISIGLPQARAEWNLNYNFEPQKSLIDISTFDPRVAEGTEQEVSFAQKYDGRLDFSLDQLIFDGSYFVGLQAVKTYRELSSKEHIKTQVDVMEAVSKAYYNALIAEERLKLMVSNLGRLDTLLNETNKMYEAGFVEKVDVDRVRVNYNNLRVENNTLNQLKDLGIKLLKFQMGMNLNQPVQLVERLEEVEVSISIVPSDDFDYRQRIEFSLLQTNKALAYFDMQNNKVQYLPKIYASFGYGYNTASSESNNFFEGRRWLNYGVLGVKTTFPIFDGFHLSNKIQQNKLQVRQIENQMSLLKKNIDLEVEQSTIHLKNQLEILDVQKQNVKLAQDIYHITKVKYQEGVGSNLEVIDAENALKEAHTNYLNTLYQAIISQIELKKALGTLYKN